MATPEPRSEPPAPATRPGTNPPGAGPDTGRDSWASLGAHTAARIALGKAGGSLRTASLLELRLAHAGARDAVHAPFDVDHIGQALNGLGLATERLETGATDRKTYLLRPDLGRALRPESAEHLRGAAAAWGRRDLVILVSDGLSATAAGLHAVATVAELARILTGAGWTLYPIFLAAFARVKLQDAVGGLLQARHSLILLGERPGMSAHDSLGAYLTFEPRADRTDADRNCVSNIRPGGLPPVTAAREIAHLLLESRRQGLSGVRLKAAGENRGSIPA